MNIGRYDHWFVPIFRSQLGPPQFLLALEYHITMILQNIFVPQNILKYSRILLNNTRIRNYINDMLLVMPDGMMERECQRRNGLASASRHRQLKESGRLLSLFQTRF